MDSGPQHAPTFQRLDHVAVVAGTVIAVAGLLEVALDRLRLIPRVKRLFTREAFTQNSIWLRTSGNHVPYRRVASLASDAAGRGADADVGWLCRLQR